MLQVYALYPSLVPCCSRILPLGTHCRLAWLLRTATSAQAITSHNIHGPPTSSGQPHSPWIITIGSRLCPSGLFPVSSACYTQASASMRFVYQPYVIAVLRESPSTFCPSPNLHSFPPKAATPKPERGASIGPQVHECAVLPCNCLRSSDISHLLAYELGRRQSMVVCMPHGIPTLHPLHRSRRMGPLM